jgi:Cdc6-like AAA superfamily ATPase
MEVLGTAVGVASLGIQVCQGLLTYYDTWKTYDSDISDACRFIAELSKTFSVLQGSLKDPTLDKERAERVSNALQSCSDALIVLSARAQKLRKHAQPVSTAQKVLWQTQRLQYPFRAKTLSKLKANVDEIQSSLQIALQVLQLDVTQQSQKVFLDLRRSQQLRTLVDWLSPSDPWTNHASASQRRQPYTGEWLLKSHEYQDWKLGNVRNTWLYGKPGCGKTILCSSVIEDVRAHCEGDENFQLAAFYFTFSEQRKQSYGDLLRSISEQLGSQEPGLSLLQQAYEECKKTPPRLDDLEKLVITCAKLYKTVYIVLDALDESPSDMDARYEMLQGLERLIAGTSSIKVLATSRELRDIRETMEIIQAQFVPIATSAVDADIELYVSQQLSQDRRLSRVGEKLKILIQKTISSKADGM